MNHSLKLEAILSLLLYRILLNLLDDPIVCVSFILKLCFGETSRVVFKFQEAVQSLPRSYSALDHHHILEHFGGTFDFQERSRYALLRAMSKTLHESISRQIFESEFPDAYVEAVCAAMEGAAKTCEYSLYCIESISDLIHGSLLAMKQGTSVAPLLSKDVIIQSMNMALHCLDSEDSAVTRISLELFNQVLDLSNEEDTRFGMELQLHRHALLVCSGMHKAKKAKYRMLSVLLHYIDASDVLFEIPNHIHNTIVSIALDKGVRKAAAMSLIPIWKSLQLEQDASKFSEDDSPLGQHSKEVLSSVVNSLLDESKIVRSAALVSVVPGLLEECPSSFFFLLQSLLKKQSSSGWLGSCMGLLACGRKFSIFTSIESLEGKGMRVFDLLEKAIVDQDEYVEVAAMQLLVAGNSNKTINLPSMRELELIWKYFNMAIRCTSASARQENLSGYARFLTRIKVSVAATLTRPESFDPGVHQNVSSCEIWIKAFCQMCLSCLHPGSVYGKRYMAIELLCMTMEAFNMLVQEERTVMQSFSRGSPYSFTASKRIELGQGLKYGNFHPFPSELYSRATSNLLYCAMRDNWNRIRSTSMCILLMLPNSDDDFDGTILSQKIVYSLDLLQRPRLSDLDAGSRILGILYQKYFAGGMLNLQLKSSREIKVIQNSKSEGYCSSNFIRCLIEMAKAEVMSVKCGDDSSSFTRALSSLTSLRYLVRLMEEDIMIRSIESLHNLTKHAASIIMPILSSPEDNLSHFDTDQEDMNGLVGDDETEQVVRYKSWMISKEICHLVESIWHAMSEVSTCTDFLRLHLHLFADIIIQMLLGAKHYGTIDYARAVIEKMCSSRVFDIDMSQLVIEQMFDHMLRVDQSRRDAIRRSGGLPFGIHSVMVANPKSQLTKNTMSRLIDICQGNHKIASEMYWPKVHALNALRLIFSDSRLSSLDRFYSISFKIVLLDLSNANWEIRNSAALCFTSLVTKVLGFANIKRVNHVDVWPPRSPTAQEFFDAYKEVDRFILDIIQNSSSAYLQNQEFNALLAPVLALLGRLRPSQASVNAGSLHMRDIRAYADSLVAILKSQDISIRKLASRAFVSVVPFALWPSYSKDLSASIHEMVRSKCTDWNAIHGNLAVMTEMLKALYSIMDQNDDIDGSLFFEMGKSICDGMSNPCLQFLIKCPPVIAELLKVCILLCRIEQKWNDKYIFEFCSKSVVDCLWSPLMALSDDKKNMGKPMFTTCLRRVIKLAYIWCLPKIIELENGSFVAYLGNIIDLLKHSFYEVREAVLKSLLHSFQRIQKSSLNETQGRDRLGMIYAYLSASWEQETLHGVKLLMLSVLNMFHENASKLSLQICIKQFSFDLVDRYSESPSVLSQVIIACAYASSANNSSDSLDFLRLLERYSRPEYPEEIRMSCVCSIQIRKVLHRPKEVGSTLADAHVEEFLRFWNVALMLLEDESANVRNNISNVVHQAITEDEEGYVRVDHVQEKVLPWLQDRLSSHPAFMHQLQSWICDPCENSVQCIHEFEFQQRKILFLTEKANQHEDPLILVNLAAMQLSVTTLNPEEIEACSMLKWLDESAKYIINIIDYFEDFERRTKDADKVSCQYCDLFSSCAYEHMYRLWAAVWSSSLKCFHAMMELPQSRQTLEVRMRTLSSITLKELFSVNELSLLIADTLAPGVTPGGSEYTFPISHRLRVL